MSQSSFRFLLIRILRPLQRLYWFVFRPKTAGVKVAIVYDGRVLLVKNSYGSGLWTLPGGGIEKDETPLQAAEREVWEELRVALSDMQLCGSFASDGEYKRDRVHVVRAITDSSTFTPDLFEIADASWFLISEARREPSKILQKCLDMCNL